MVQERLLMLLGENKTLPVYIHAEKGIKLDEEVVDSLLNEMKEKNLTFIIFDSLSVIHTAEENSATEMGAVFEQLKRFTREGITVLFTNHHRKKPGRGAKDDAQEQTRGSTVINAVPSGHITCEETTIDDKKFLLIRQPKLKSARKLNPFFVLIEEKDGKFNFVYERDFEEAADAAVKLKARLLEIFGETSEWLGIKDLTEMCGYKSDSAVRDQLKHLLDDNQIARKTRSTLTKTGASVSKRENASPQEYLYFLVGQDAPAEDILEQPPQETLI